MNKNKESSGAGIFHGTGEKAEKEKKDSPEEKITAAEQKKKDEKETAREEKKDREEKKAEKKEEKKDEGKKPESAKKDPKDEKIEELTDRLQRSLAEFDNYRKRTEKEKTAMFDMGARDILEKLLPVVDNFERSLSAAPDSEECKAYTDGMKMIYKQLQKNLEDAGVRPIDCKGKPFDPEYHNAVMHVEDKQFGENTVAEELQKGYMYKDTVLRHSMVKVAN